MQEGGSENKSQQGRVHKASEQLSSQKYFRFKNLKKLEVSFVFVGQEIPKYSTGSY